MEELTKRAKPRRRDRDAESGCGWTAQEMIKVWARARRDEYAAPMAEVRRLSGLGGNAIRSELVGLAVTRYVEGCPGFERARRLLMHRHVHGLDWGDFPALGSGETLLKSLLALGLSDLIYLPKRDIPRIAEYRFWWELRFHLIDNPPSGHLARALDFVRAQEQLEGPVTSGEMEQWRVLVTVKRAARRGDMSTVRVGEARLAAIQKSLAEMKRGT